MDKLKLAIAAIVIMAIGVGVGRFTAPDSVKTGNKQTSDQSKTVEEGTKTTKKFDPETGKVIEETTEKGTKTTTENSKTSEKTKETIRNKKMWAVKGGVAVDPRDSMKLIPRVGGEIRLPLFDSWAGVEADVNLAHPILGAYLRLEF